MLVRVIFALVVVTVYANNVHAQWPPSEARDLTKRAIVDPADVCRTIENLLVRLQQMVQGNQILETELAILQRFVEGRCGSNTSGSGSAGQAYRYLREAPRQPAF